MKTFKQLEEERKQKQFFNEMGTWTFKDYQKYGKRKENRKTTIVNLIIAFIVYFTVGAFITFKESISDSFFILSLILLIFFLFWRLDKFDEELKEVEK